MADTFKGIITSDGKKRTFAREGVTPQYESDKTLSIDGEFADAKIVGDKFKSIDKDLSNKANGKGITLSINESGGLRVTYDDGK